MVDPISIPAAPRVSLIVPVRNESAYIDECLASVVAQDFPRAQIEVIVVDGESTDDTVERVRAWVRRDPRIRLARNPDRAMIPGFNLGLRMASGDLVGYVNGHMILPPNYVTRCIDLLRRTQAWCVGGSIHRLGLTAQGRANAAATASRIGVGDSRHNYGTTPGWVESVFPGFWPQAVFARLGSLDPTMIVNEDNEFSFRIRRAGGGVWYEPSLSLGYVPRQTLAGLFQQYRSYGAGKVAVFSRHPTSVRWRHLVPPVWLAAVTSTTLLSPWVTAARVTCTLIWAAYAGLTLGGSYHCSRSSGVSAWRVASAFLAMHVGYGSGMWSAAIRLRRRRGQRGGGAAR